MARRMTRSMTAAAAKKSAAKTLVTTEAVSSGPPTKRRKTNKAGDKAAKVTRDLHIPKAPPPAKLSRLLDPTKTLRSVASPTSGLELPVPADALPGQPRIYYGQDAPYPRWRTLLDVQPPGKDVEKDLIRTHAGRTIIPGVAPNTYPRAHDPNVGLAGLKWVFDPGPPTVWGSLTGQQLHTHAHNCLSEALEGPQIRQQLRDALRNEQYATIIANVEDPLPPMPRLIPQGAAAPLNSDFNRIMDSAHQFKTGSQNFSGANKYKRPGLNLSRLGEAGSNEAEDRGIASTASTLTWNMKGTLGHPDHQDPSFDPFEHAVPHVKAAIKRPKRAERPAAEDATKRALEGVGSQDIEIEEKTVGMPPPALHEPIPAPVEAGGPAEDEGRIARIEAEPSSNGKSVPYVLEAQGQQRAAGKKAVKGPVQGDAPGSSRTAERQESLAGATKQDISKILYPSGQALDEASRYFRVCNGILDNPQARQKHYPKVAAFRRIRSWAGAIMPEEVAAHVKANVSKVPTANRPFRNMKRPREGR